MGHAEAITWLERLSKQLEDRRPAIKQYDDYYEGQHKLEFATEKFRKVFGDMFDAFSDNWCGPVVDAKEERLTVVGFRFGEDEDADDDANRIWQANQLDALHQLAHLESMIASTSSVLVWADPKRGDTPRITIESPYEMAVASDPGNPLRRDAAVKVWTDEWTGERFATVYLPDGIYKFRKTRRSTTTALTVVRRFADRDEDWTIREVAGETWPLKNPMGVVPVVPLPNRPRLLKPGVSELKSVVPLQNAVNKLVTDMLVASELGALPARWATGWQAEEDPETHQVLPAKVTDYLNKFVWSGDPNARFGSFEEADLKAFATAIELVVQHIASQTRTPPHYLTASADRLSGESIKSSETGLVAAVERKQVFYGEAWEQIIRLAFGVLGDARKDVDDAEAIWKDPESRTESEHVDAVGKKRKLLNIPLKQAWADAGYTPPQIKRMESMLAAERLTGMAADLAALDAGDTEPTQDPEGEPAAEPAA